MASSEQVLKNVLGDKRAQLKVKRDRKASLDAEVARLEDEVAKLESHVNEVYPKIEEI